MTPIHSHVGRLSAHHRRESPTTVVRHLHICRDTDQKSSGWQVICCCRATDVEQSAGRSAPINYARFSRLLKGRRVEIYLLTHSQAPADDTVSHTRTVVRECCKVDDASQWENGKFDPLSRPNPLTDRHKKLHTSKMTSYFKGY